MRHLRSGISPGVSRCAGLRLSQRQCITAFSGGTSRDAPAGGIGALALGECLLIGAVSQKQAGQAIVSLVTTWLEIDPICLVTLPLELLDHAPRSRPHGRILDRVNDLEGVGTGASPAFDEMQVLAGSLKVPPGREIRHVDNERITLPTGTRIS